MYRLSLLPRKVIITTDEVIAQGPVVENVDPGNILRSIQIAEERFIKPALTPELYYDFRNKKNVVVDDVNKTFLEGLVNEGNNGEHVPLQNNDIINAIEFVDVDLYRELWFEHLWKLTAECVIHVATPTNYSRYTAQGEVSNNPKTITTMEGQGSFSVDLQTVKWKLDKMMMDRIDPLLKAMHEWLCEHKDSFPLYKGNCGQCKPEKSAVRQTAWIGGLYEDERNKHNCCD